MIADIIKIFAIVNKTLSQYKYEYKININYNINNNKNGKHYSTTIFYILNKLLLFKYCMVFTYNNLWNISMHLYVIVVNHGIIVFKNYI